ncbi:hypothetical protein NQT69_18115 [Pseudoalteromonas shioyasakiensis]|uniref:hypothetical protein n=1 Tax=Pseudoalteromonas shioyasakiensis TaxID=1190813 RepID=UPI0021174D1D|nr:hypothetical protein [Pseudoalteromonas shioyasakiensis]MCQ8879916.1 hypothetical protein [Pseudoalteromonas shioyasakiensis]
MKLKSILLSAMLLVGVVGCVEPESDNTLKVIEVTDHAFKLNGEDAVTVFIGHRDSPEFGFTILKSDLKKGTLIQSISGSADNLKVSASVGAKYYKQSMEQGTSASLQVLELDKQAKTAKLAVGAKLYDPNLKDFKELEITVVELTGVNFENLVKEHP